MSNQVGQMVLDTGQSADGAAAISQKQGFKSGWGNYKNVERQFAGLASLD